MALIRLKSVTIGVPDVPRVAAYYSDFGLSQTTDDSPTAVSFATLEGGEQLTLRATPLRRLLGIALEADSEDHLLRLSADPTVVRFTREPEPTLVLKEPGAGVEVTITVGTEGLHGRILGRVPAERTVNSRAPEVQRTQRPRPLRLGHVVMGSPDHDASMAFFTRIGFKVSDYIKDVGAFLRCSIDHHNLLVQRAPVAFLHHTSWEVNDADDVGRAASAMLEEDPSRHGWGFGRHLIGSNYFWYLRDPAGNMTEYFADMDEIIDDALWSPEVFSGKSALAVWGPPAPASFLRPDDLAELMQGSH